MLCEDNPLAPVAGIGQALVRATAVHPLLAFGRVVMRQRTMRRAIAKTFAHRDAFGIESLAHVGEDNITFETDYPHSDSTWPDTKEVAEKMFAGLSDEVIYKLVRGNAIKMLGLETV